MKRPIDAVTADTLRLLIPVDIPEPWAELDLADDLAYLLPLLASHLATGTRRETLANRINRNWPPSPEAMP